MVGFIVFREEMTCLLNKTFALFSQIDASSFTMTFFGQGYSQGFGPDKNKPNIRICTQVKGPGISRMT